MESLTPRNSSPDCKDDGEYLIKLLKEGHQRLNKKCENAVLTLGVTGEGKSTLVSAFGGFKLNARLDEETMSIYIEHVDKN